MSEDLAMSVTASSGQPATVRVGQILSLSPLTIDLNGTTLDPATVGVAASSLPAAGPVLLLGQSVQGGSSSGASWTVLGGNGKAASSTKPTDVSFQGQLDVQTTAIAAFGNVLIGGQPVTLTLSKTHTGKRIFASISVAARTEVVVNSGVAFGVNINGADHQLAAQFINPASIHIPVVGFRHLPGSETWAPGEYVGTLRWRRYAGTGTITADNNDFLSWRLQQVD